MLFQLVDPVFPSRLGEGGEVEIGYSYYSSLLYILYNKMEKGELDIDKMIEQLKVAQNLIKLCKNKLTETDKEIKELLEVSDE